MFISSSEQVGGDSDIEQVISVIINFINIFVSIQTCLETPFDTYSDLLLLVWVK